VLPPATLRGPAAGPRNLLEWLTLERVAYGLALLLAAGLRLVDLGQTPMAPAEAAQAWVALAQVRGEALLPPPGTSPLLLSLQYLTFLLAAASELWARFWPTVAGTLLVLLPYGLRRRLGRPAALAAAFLLAISTNLVFWSRSGTGESFAALGALGLVLCLDGYCREGVRPWAAWGAASLAVLLMSAPAGYSALLAIAPLALVLLRHRTFCPLPGPARQGAMLRAGLILVAALLLGSTALLLVPQGLAALAELPVAWLRELVQPGGYALSTLLLQLVLEETFLLAVGVAGLVLGLRRGDALARGLGIWLAIALLLLLRPGRSPADGVVVVLPLALLGGQALAAYAGRLRDLAAQPWEALALAIAGLALLGFTAIWLADYGASPQQVGDRVFLIYAGLGLGLLLALFLLAGLYFGSRVTATVGIAVLLLGLLLPSLRASWEMSHNDDGLRWGSLLSTIGATDGPGIPEYLQQLARQATPYGGDLFDLPVALVVAPGTEPNPLLHWYLRDADVREIAGAGADSGEQVIVALPEESLALGEGYAGRSYRLTQSWAPTALEGTALWRWLILSVWIPASQFW
ncbi:MAG: hypothetical protein ACK2U9_15325, partial [Anaerolineae bacterium]